MWFGQEVIGVFVLTPLLQIISSAQLDVASNAAGLAIQITGIGLIIAGVIVFFVGRKD
jgi:hypothetical protein